MIGPTVAGIMLGLVCGTTIAIIILSWKLERLSQQVQALKEQQQ